MSQAMLPPDELSFNDSKTRQPIFLSSLYEKRLPQKTLSLPSTPQPDSNEPSLYSFASSALRVDDSSFISSIISPSLSRSSYQIITCSDFILRDIHPTKQRRSFSQLYSSALSLPASTRLPSEKDVKNKKIGREKVKLENAYPKSLLQRKSKLFPTFTPEFLSHRILLKLHDLNYTEALELAALIPEDKIKSRHLIPYWTAVFRAAILAGCESIPVLLLDKGLPISPDDTVYPQDPTLGFPPPDYFITICAFGLNKVASAMLKKAQVNKTWMGVTPLMYASGQGNSILIQLLLENGANPYYNIPLKHLRVWRKAHSTIGGASLTQFPNSNRTSFGSFTKYFNPESSLEMINPAIESYPVYPLDFASGSLNVTAVYLLASTMSASSLKNDKFGLLLQQSTSISRILLKGGVDPNQVDGVGNSPIHLATMSNRLDLVELLYQHGAQINLPGIRKSTPLHLAVKFHNPRIALALVCYKADRQAKDCNGNTPEELGNICGIEASALAKYFDTSNISSEKINACFADMLVPIKAKKANFFSPTFLRKWVSMKKSKRESFMSLSFSTDGVSSSEKKPDTSPMARSYSTGSWLSSRPKSAGVAFRDKLANLIPKNH